jgi:hypothetical protein
MSELKDLESRVAELERRLAAMTGTPFASQEEPEPEKKHEPAKAHAPVKRSR